ncbi:preprotein translocase subunit SecY [Lacticaseibacillus paracasei]|uniref:preprotein translocase subunit SecY n=1 Tax=Lacticaseibacillus paracasei TaxID=1597 RepID=UPI003396D85A
MKNKHEMLRRALWTAMTLGIVALGQLVLLPGTNIAAASDELKAVPFLQLVAGTTGSQLQNATILSLGMRPYMTGMIVWQAIQMLFDEQIQRWTLRQTGIAKRLITLLFAFIQGFEMVYVMRSAIKPVYLPGFSFNFGMLLVWIILIGGAMFTTWLGDVNMQKGLGSSVALIIPSLVFSLPNVLNSGFYRRTHPISQQEYIIAGVVVLLFIVIMTVINEAELHIPVERPLMENDLAKSYLPIRLLVAGSMPFMFSSSMFTLPTYFINQTVGPTNELQRQIIKWFSYNTPQGIFSYAMVMVFLGYAFGYMNMQPSKIAKNLKESGDYIINQTPGEMTNHFLLRHFSLMSIWGNFILVVIAVTPLIIGLKYPPIANYSVMLGQVFILVTIMDTVSSQMRALWYKNRYQVI